MRPLRWTPLAKLRFSAARPADFQTRLRPSICTVACNENSPLGCEFESDGVRLVEYGIDCSRHFASRESVKTRSVSGVLNVEDSHSPPWRTISEGHHLTCREPFYGDSPKLTPAQPSMLLSLAQ